MSSSAPRIGSSTRCTGSTGKIGRASPRAGATSARITSLAARARLRRNPHPYRKSARRCRARPNRRPPTPLVPNIRAADTLDFAGYHAAYEETIRKVRGGKITPDDFEGTTVTLTNPGMIGTVLSVPRLMSGQGAIIGAGAIDYPTEYKGTDPATLAAIGVGKVGTLTSTYDHRIIAG